VKVWRLLLASVRFFLKMDNGPQQKSIDYESMKLIAGAGPKEIREQMKKSWQSEDPAFANTSISNTYCSSTFTLTSTSSTISSAYIFTSSLSGNVCSTAASTTHNSASVSSTAKPQSATGWQDVSCKSRNGGIKKGAGAVLSPPLLCPVVFLLKN